MHNFCSVGCGSKGFGFVFTPLHNQNADFVGSFPKGRARGCRLRI